MNVNQLKYKIVKGHSKFTNFTIPVDWQLSSIGLIGKYINGMAIKPEQWKKSGVPIIRIQNLTDELSPFNYFDEGFDKEHEINDGDILISWSATLGVFRWKRGKAVLNQHIFKAIPNIDIDKDFFYFALVQQVEQMKKMIHGTTMKHITKQPFLDTSVPLPPLTEQQKIAYILSKLDELIKKTDKIIEQTQILKKGLMQRLLTNGIGHTNFKKIKTEEIPKEWDCVKLVDIAKVRYGLSQPPKLAEKGVPLIRATNIKRGKIIQKDMLLVDSRGINKDVTLRNGDIIVVRSGAYTGDVGYIDEQYDGSLAGYDLIVTPSNKIDSIFLLQVLLSPRIQNYFSQLKDRVAQSHLNSKQLEQAIIYLPVIKEQKVISSFIVNLDKIIQTNISLKSKNESLKKGLMQQLLTGRIRVKI